MMMIKLLSLALLAGFAVAHNGQDNSPYEVNVAAVDYMDAESYALQGFVSYPEDLTTVVPAVVIIPDWDGVNEYEQQRATLLTELGYVGFAADIYGPQYHNVESQDERISLLIQYRSNVTLFVQRIQAAVQHVKTLSGVDASRVAVIGYCFGGTGVMEYALTGQDDVAALVSFHGGLATIDDYGVKAHPKLLVLSGGDDDTSTDIIDLEDSLKRANASWEITRYSGIEHAFTNFNDARYNTWADYRSWYSMHHFLEEAFDITPFDGQAQAGFDVTPVNYTDVDGKALTGYLAMPSSQAVIDRSQEENFNALPAVIILPDWDGVNKYEKERATLLARNGYIAFAADIYGSDLQEGLDFATRFQQTGLYRGNPDLFNQRTQRAIDLVKALPEVDASAISLIGYCFGGTGVLEYAYTGSTDVVAIASFHGGHQDLPTTPLSKIHPYVLILSGGIDDAHGNQTEMELSMNERDAEWEISRYAEVGHGYTDWESPAYNLMADARSWDAMMSTLAILTPVEGNEMQVFKPEFVKEETSGTSSVVSMVGLLAGVVAMIFA